eukprot:TRINITY_DN8580_c0_g1_i1.p1 TRINITY_DN8580_c0_g1~~TRINITY_DN8580_c0_g1_i1.p1  ORF type:complete len:182 (-),score=33.07 TRINITY_DN8580_c0_g1_i1:77-622(-)
MNTPIPSEFHETDHDMISNILNVNGLFTTYLTRAIVPQLIARKARSAIINVGSVSACFPSSPMMSVYAASKAYMASWSKSLSAELAHYNWDVRGISPWMVATAMSGLKKATLMVSTPRSTARETISKLGIVNEITPNWFHYMERCFAWILPEPISSSLMRDVLIQRRKIQLQELNGCVTDK